MSKARLVITAAVIEGRSQGEVARSYGVSQGWVSRHVARHRAEGEAAYEPRSRRPHRSPGAISDEVAGLIIALRKDLTGQGLDGGPHTAQGWSHRTRPNGRGRRTRLPAHRPATRTPARHTPQNQKPRTQIRVRGHSDVLRHHMARSEGLEPPTF